MRVLIIHDLIPEETILADVEMTEEEYKYFSQAHGFIINVGDDETKSDVVNVIGNALDENPDHIKFCVSGKERKYFGKWKRTDIKDIEDITGFDKFIKCGFYL